MLHLKICHHVRATKSVLRWTWDSHSGMLTRRVPLAGQELPTLPEHLSSPLVFSGIRAARSFVFCVMSCRSLFVLSSFFICPLCFLSVFHLPILITPLAYSNSSYGVLCYKQIWPQWLYVWDDRYNVFTDIEYLGTLTIPYTTFD